MPCPHGMPGTRYAVHRQTSSLRGVTFQGIPIRALEFYEGLEADNSRTYWTRHRAVYDDCVRAPLQAIADTLEAEFGTPKLFRPHRDVRFSADKSPYKTHQGLVVGTPPSLGYYVQISADGLAVGGGFHAASPAQTAAWRAAADAPGTGSEIARLVAAATATGAEVRGEQVKTTPRGYAVDHPRIDLIRRRELMLIEPLGAPDWLETPAALDEIANRWRRLTPLLTILDAALGSVPTPTRAR
ncbi:MAG TPA: DUF2461 domain-containing protein [Dermatophilaceae bacterium]|jgi:uncharacterized protein (TIGR02453 family)|nr:DUF2461 domain-containing protein [Dermatophilaceae bacterium]